MENEIVVITGGSSGIGRALAIEYVKKGSTVIIGARRLEILNQVKYEMQSISTNKNQIVEANYLDVSNEKSVSEFINSIIKLHKKIDLLINCAGISICKENEKTNIEEIKNVIYTNYLGVVYMVKAILPYMIEKKSGHIINISSLAGVMGVYGYSAYTPSKYAIVGYSDVLRAELLPHNINVSLVLPPDTDTPQFHNENITKPNITKKISGTIKPMSANRVAVIIMKSINKRKYLIIPGINTKIVYNLNRFFPNLIFLITKNIIRKQLINN